MTKRKISPSPRLQLQTKNIVIIVSVMTLLTLVLVTFVTMFMSSLIMLLFFEVSDEDLPISFGFLIGSLPAATYLFWYAPSLYAGLNEHLPLGGVFFFLPKHRAHRSKSMR